MTTQEAIDDIEYFAQNDTGLYFGASPTDAQLVSLLNWATQLIGLRIQTFRPDNTLTLTLNGYKFDLQLTTVVAQKVIRPHFIIINGNPLFDITGRQMGFWSMPDLVGRVSPTFWLDSASTPSRAVWMNPKLYLYPKVPQSVIDAGENFVSGTVFPTDRTADGDANTGLGTQLDLPLQLHKAACYLATVKGGNPQVAEQDAWNRLAVYNAEWGEIAKQIALENAHSATEYFSGSSYGDPAFRVQL